MRWGAVVYGCVLIACGIVLWGRVAHPSDNGSGLLATPVTVAPEVVHMAGIPPRQARGSSATRPVRRAGRAAPALVRGPPVVTKRPEPSALVTSLRSRPQPSALVRYRP